MLDARLMSLCCMSLGESEKWKNIFFYKFFRLYYIHIGIEIMGDFCCKLYEIRMSNLKHEA
jgi:hypothetical protein